MTSAPPHPERLGKLDYILCTVALIAGIWFIPIWWKSVLFTVAIMNYKPLLFYPAAILGAISGIYLYFKMYPEDKQKVKDYFIPAEAHP